MNSILSFVGAYLFPMAVAIFLISVTELLGLQRSAELADGRAGVLPRQAFGFLGWTVDFGIRSQLFFAFLVALAAIARVGLTPDEAHGMDGVLGMAPFLAVATLGMCLVSSIVVASFGFEVRR